VFRQWTDAEGIIDYLIFAKTYIGECEEQLWTPRTVERLLDSRACADEPRRAPAIRGAPSRTCAPRSAGSDERREHDERLFNDLWQTTVPHQGQEAGPPLDEDLRRSRDAAAAAGEHPVFPGEDRAAAGALAARGAAHRPPRSLSTSTRSARPR